MKKKISIAFVLMLLLVSIFLILINISIIAVPNDESTISNEQEEVQDAVSSSLKSSGYVRKTMFSDLKGNHWAVDYIETMARSKVINGYEDGTFRPESKLKTGEFIKMLACMYFPDYQFEQPKEGKHWAYQYVKNLELVIWTVDTTKYYSFDELEKTITREEMAELIALSYSTNKKLIISNYNEENIFSDKDLIKSNYKRYVDFCVKYGLLNGFEDNTFRPTEVLTRAQAAKVIYMIKR